MKNNNQKKLKTLQAGFLSTLLLTSGTVLNVGCQQQVINNNFTEQDQVTLKADFGDSVDDNELGGTPYNQIIGNGNYFCHSFIGKDTVITKENAAQINQHYVGKARIYAKDSISDLNASLDDRLSAKKYFENFSKRIQNNDVVYFNSNPYFPAQEYCDYLINTISQASAPILINVIKNLDNDKDRTAFYVAYRVLANESFKMGINLTDEKQKPMIDGYKQERGYLIWLAKRYKTDDISNPFSKFDLENEYKKNDFTGTTNIMDEMLTTAVSNLNERQNLDLKLSDMQKFINLSITSRPLESMHNKTIQYLRHGKCGVYYDLNRVMSKAIYDAKQIETISNKEY